MSPALSFWKERARSLTQALPEFLTWQSGRDLERAVSDLYETWFDKRLGTWVSAPDDQRIVARLAALPPVHWRRVRQSPRVALMVRSGRVATAEDRQALDAFLHAEEYLAGLRPDAPGTETALGDYLVDARVPPFAARAAAQAALQKSAAAAAASDAEPMPPYAVRGIYVDASCRDLLGHPSLGDPQPYLPGEVPELLRHAERGLARVESVSADALRMIQSNILVLALIRGTANPRQLSSGSDRSHMGLMSLANLTTAGWTPEHLAEGFVHEAIHSLLYRIELAEFLHDTDPDAMTERAQSPWSGRSLPLNTFVHACFVWFGLWNFWRLSQQIGQDCPPLRERSEKGFMGATLASVMPASGQSRLRPQVRDAIDEMFARVNAAPTAA